MRPKVKEKSVFFNSTRRGPPAIEREHSEAPTQRRSCPLAFVDVLGLRRECASCVERSPGTGRVDLLRDALGGGMPSAVSVVTWYRSR